MKVVLQDHCNKKFRLLGSTETSRWIVKVKAQRLT
ncbi:hypothetical protein SLEP1_g5454 [Rubroshorea leprosula]|uniref:Uncharacterized protein n=1 Tax=Rubroshorea leprosula TaxID=152421 RepID=A0AAV5HS03_9ROSI|nr:hypothetical protein SLEP1_g5454 [Rubroshorea leprosula]